MVSAAHCCLHCRSCAACATAGWFLHAVGSAATYAVLFAVSPVRCCGFLSGLPFLTLLVPPARCRALCSNTPPTTAVAALVGAPTCCCAVHYDWFTTRAYAAAGYLFRCSTCCFGWFVNAAVFSATPAVHRHVHLRIVLRSTANAVYTIVLLVLRTARNTTPFSIYSAAGSLTTTCIYCLLLWCLPFSATRFRVSDSGSLLTTTAFYICYCGFFLTFYCFACHRSRAFAPAAVTHA